MSILAWILVGLGAGWLAETMLKGPGEGVLYSMVLGSSGALPGGLLAVNLLNAPDPLTRLDLTSLVIAFLGAVIAVALVRALPSGYPL